MTDNRIVFLSSGGGGNLRLIHALTQSGALPDSRIAAVVADRECAALTWAGEVGIPAHLVPYRRDDPQALHEVLTDLNADIVVTNIHKILDEVLVERFAGRMLNLHYSLLPAFGGFIGMAPVNAARDLGSRIIGATAHVVTASVDAGPIIAQACVADSSDRSLDVLHNDVFRCGGVALAAAIAQTLGASAESVGMLTAGSTDIFASPLPVNTVCEQMASEDFWAALT